ncbi:hypothetical protein Tco_0583067 [Tanacetum coccineum]
MLWEWRGIANMDFIQLGGSSRVGEMILARERSGFAGEKVWDDHQVVPGFVGRERRLFGGVGSLAVLGPSIVFSQADDFNFDLTGPIHLGAWICTYMADCRFEGPSLLLSLNTCSLALLGCASSESEFHGSMTGGSVFAHTVYPIGWSFVVTNASPTESEYLRSGMRYMIHNELDTAYYSSWIRRIGNYLYAFSCEELALIRCISFSGYGVSGRNEQSSNIFVLAPKYAPFSMSSQITP